MQPKIHEYEALPKHLHDQTEYLPHYFDKYIFQNEKYVFQKNHNEKYICQNSRVQPLSIFFIQKMELSKALVIIKYYNITQCYSKN